MAWWLGLGSAGSRPVPVMIPPKVGVAGRKCSGAWRGGVARPVPGRCPAGARVPGCLVPVMFPPKVGVRGRKCGLAWRRAWLGLGSAGARVPGCPGARVPGARCSGARCSVPWLVPGRFP